MRSGGVSEDDYQSVRDDITASNRANLLVFSAISLVFFLVAFGLSFFVAPARANRYYYVNFQSFYD